MGAPDAAVEEDTEMDGEGDPFLRLLSETGGDVPVPNRADCTNALKSSSSWSILTTAARNSGVFAYSGVNESCELDADPPLELLGVTLVAVAFVAVVVVVEEEDDAVAGGALVDEPDGSSFFAFGETFSCSFALAGAVVVVVASAAGTLRDGEEVDSLLGFLLPPNMPLKSDFRFSASSMVAVLEGAGFSSSESSGSSIFVSSELFRFLALEGADPCKETSFAASVAAAIR